MGIFYVSFLSRVIFSPIMPRVERDLGIDHGGAGSLFLLISLGFAISTLASSAVSSRMPHNRIILLTSITTGFALIFVSLSLTLTGIRLGIIAVGLATGLYLPSAIATITDLTHPRHWGRAIGVHELATTFAFFSAPIIAEVFLKYLGWREALATIGILSIISGAASFILKGGKFRGEAPTKGILRPLLGRSIFWIILFTFILGVGGNFGIYSIMPLYLVSEVGLEREAANTLVSLSRPAGVLFVFLAGWASDRFGHWKILSVVLFGSGTLLLLIGIFQGDWIRPLIIIQPAFAVAFFPPAYSALSCSSSMRQRSLITSLTISTAILVGGGAIPAIIGVLGDLGNFSFGIALLGGFILLGGVLLILNQRVLDELEYEK